MKLKGSYLHDVNFHLSQAREMKIEEHPLKIYLSINPIENIKNVEKDLEENYQAKVLNHWKLINTLNVEIPTKNLKKVVEKDYVQKYDWPGTLELLTCT